MNPYQPPEADVDRLKEVEVPVRIAKKIKTGWIAAIVSGLITLFAVLVAITSGGSYGVINIWSISDVLLIFVLAFGIYKKSRVAATAMFLYFLASKLLIIVETGRASGLFLSLIFIYFYFNAMVATYQYHKLLQGFVADVKEAS